MKNLTILHISDLHFSKKNVTPKSVHIKDKSTSKKFISSISNNAEDQFLSDILSFKPIDGFDLIACTGDLGEFGIKDNIELGAKYLDRLAKILLVHPSKVLVSPGNHDLKRRKKPVDELKDFSQICINLGFTYTDYNSSKLNTIKDIPILIINTCLGGTEKAYYGYKKSDWNRIRIALKKDNRILKEDLDIPAIGNLQLSSLKSDINSTGDFSIILMHHNPLPTNNTELRPYSNIIDAGKFISYCMEAQRHILILHGHTHCDAELTVTKYDNKGDLKGWVTAIGRNKFYNSASKIEIWLTKNNDFIRADITDFDYVSSKYNPNFRTILRSTKIPKEPLWFSKSPIQGKRLSFIEFAKIIGVNPDEDLAVELLQNENKSFDIQKHGSNNFNDWSITRI